MTGLIIVVIYNAVIMMLITSLTNLVMNGLERVEDYFPFVWLLMVFKKLCQYMKKIF